MIGRTKLVNARRLIRRMRGTARSHLIEADDGCAYVVKFTNNPQGGRRVLVNEFISSVLLTHLGVATPERALVHIGGQCVSDYGPLPTGPHFGSLYPTAPDAGAVYDFLPDALLPRVSNRDHFLGVLMFDQWTSNIDARQAIFFRQFKNPSVPVAAERAWIAQMIDNGSAFGGSEWAFRESAAHGVYGRPVYGPDLTVGAFNPWLDALMDLRFEVMDEAVAGLPQDWSRGEERTLEGLLAQLYERRAKVPAMLSQAVRALVANRMRLPVRHEVRSGRDLQTTA